MVSVKLKFRPSKIDGKEGSLYYQIIYNRVVRQIAIPYKIYAHEWDSKTEYVNLCGCLERKNYLDSINWIVRADIQRINTIYNRFQSQDIEFNIDSIIDEFTNMASGMTMFVFMECIISQYLRKGQLRTSETYATTLNSFRKFRGGVDISVQDINSEILETYERYLYDNNLSPNTILFYIKHLRAVYNRAVDEELIVDKKPFKRISTTMEKTVKRAIPVKILKRLKSMDLNHSRSKCFARDMFLFSFYTRGMSFVDIAYLQKSNLKSGELFYRRKKTNQLLSIHWENCMQEILNKYQSNDDSPYLFAIIGNDDKDARQQYLNALYRINRQLRIIGQEVGLNQPLTMYCARHSWASIAREEGIPLSVISEGMGHDSEKTTQIYLASIKTEVIDKANRKILSLL